MSDEERDTSGSEDEANIEPDEEMEDEADSEEDEELLDTEEDKEQLLQRAKQELSSTDFILEPKVFETLISYLSNGGEAKDATRCLSEGYQGLAQLCNTVGKWLVDTGIGVDSVQTVFEQHLSGLIEKNFDPKKANTIFDRTEGVDWLSDLIAYSPWRSLLYRLAETTPDCLMLNFVVKLISDAGYQHEISSVQTASQQLEIFSRMLVSAISKLLTPKPFTDEFKLYLGELVRVACHSEHTYLYTQCLLMTLASQEQGVKGGGGAAIKCISQLLRLATEGQLKDMLKTLSTTFPVNGHDTSALSCGLISLSLNGEYDTNIVQAMHSMLTKKSLNPADMSSLFEGYSNKSDDAPPVELIRDPLFIDLLIDSLFKPGYSSRLQDVHRPKYIYLLSYAASVNSTSNKKGKAKPIVNVSELEQTRSAVERMSDLCQAKGDTAAEVLAQLAHIFQALKIPVVACGVLHWVRCTVTEAEYFRLHPEPVPIHLALLDEIASLHPLMHYKVFFLLQDLIEREGGGEGASGEVLMERHRTFIDRLVHLLSVGYAIPVIQFMSNRYKEGTADTSLIRYFVTETLDIVAPPFSNNFMLVFMPLVENPEIVDASVKEKYPSVDEFLTHCSETNE